MRRTLQAPLDADSARRSWDRAAADYAAGQASGRDFYRYEFFGPAQIVMCGDVAGLEILDVGCGSGYFARAMADRGARVTRIDLSPRMIAHARRLERDAPRGIAYEVLDASRLEAIADRTFDMATSCVMLQDAPDASGALREVCRVLRDGGWFLLSISHPCTDTPHRVWTKDAAGQKLWLEVDLPQSLSAAADARDARRRAGPDDPRSRVRGRRLRPRTGPARAERRWCGRKRRARRDGARSRDGRGP